VGELKPGWRRVKFGEVVRLGKERCDPVSEGIERYIGLEHIEPDDLRVRSWGDVSDGTTFTTRVRPGQVLFGKRRAYQRKVAVADFDAVCSGDIYVFESANPAKLLPELLPFLCQTEGFFDYAVGTSAGSLSPRTNWTSLAEYEFALPTVEEQLRLLNVLTSWRAATDALREAGRPAERVFDSLCEANLLPPRDDSTWRTLPIAEMCRSPRDLAIGPNGENLVSADYLGRTEGVPVIFVRDIRPNRFDYVSNVFVTEAKSQRLAIHHAVPGDLVVTKMGVPESVGIPPGLAAVVPAGFGPALITADVLRVRFDPSIIVPEYAAYILNSPWGRMQTWRLSPGSTTRFKMRLTDFARIRLSVPPLHHQVQTVEQLRRAGGSVVSLSARVQASRASMHALLNQELSSV
jgi:type I restriction enzyme S subunit